MNKAEKQKALHKIARQIAKCKICKKDKIGLPVPGEGDPDADIVFIGEAPGKQEAATGRPFVGRAGKLLRSLIAEVGLRDDEVFITSPVKYLPEYVTPTPDDIAHGREHLFEQFKVIQPRIVVVMGNTAALAVLQEKYFIGKDHGKIIRKNGVTYLISYHPAAPLYSPKLREELKKDFYKLKDIVHEKK